MQSIKSSALEPTRSELAVLSRWRAIGRLAPVYGLPILTILLIVFFSLLLPDTFPTALNARSILSDKAIIALLSLAATLPMMAGRIDLTIGFGIVMWHILAMWLLVKTGTPWPVAVLIGLPDAAPWTQLSAETDAAVAWRVDIFTGLADCVVGCLVRLILPSITLASYPTALVARLTRSSMLEILSHLDSSPVGGRLLLSLR
jgi:ABC-type dipeptide/oligopeptide/nickel transport system permease component